MQKCKDKKNRYFMCVIMCVYLYICIYECVYIYNLNHPPLFKKRKKQGWYYALKWIKN